MEMCLLKIMGRGGALLVREVRKVRPKKLTPLYLLKTNGRNERIHCCAPHNLLKEREGGRALAVHQVLRKRECRLPAPSNGSTSHTVSSVESVGKLGFLVFTFRL